MFTKTSKLKAIFKEAYNGHQLDIGLNDDNVYIIRGHIFMMKCPAEFMENEVLAELVKLTGGLPGKGEAISYVSNDEPQMTDMEFLDEDLYEQWEEGKQIVVPTRMMIMTGNDVQVVYQKTTKVTKLNRLIVVSNEMQFRYDQHAIQWKQEQEILDACSRIDLNWQMIEQNLL